MDFKSAFLNRYIKEEVYLSQSPDFKDFKNPSHVYKLKNAPYGLQQAPRTWYHRLRKFWCEKDLNKLKVDITLFIKKMNGHALLVQLYVVVIMFESIKEIICDKFSDMMQGEFEMSIMVNVITNFGYKQSKQIMAYYLINSSIAKNF